MAGFVDLTGQKFGRLMVLQCTQRASKENGGRTKYKCLCDCGSTIIADAYKIKTGHTQSCGCLQAERTSIANKTHGLSYHRLCGIWHGIKKRCYNPKAREYKDYGARGIAMCDEWKNSMSEFFQWAISHGYKDGLSIDRIETNGNYEPSNCKWSNKTEQQRNRRCNHYLTINGETKCLSGWLARTGINYKTAQKRLKMGWSPEQAIGLSNRSKTV